MQALHGVRWAYQDMAMEKNLKTPFLEMRDGVLFLILGG
jgi:hypothetical protein